MKKTALNNAEQNDIRNIFPMHFIESLPKPVSESAAKEIKNSVKFYRATLPQGNRELFTLAQMYQIVAKRLGFNSWEALNAIANGK